MHALNQAKLTYISADYYLLLEDKILFFNKTLLYFDIKNIF